MTARYADERDVGDEHETAAAPRVWCQCECGDRLELPRHGYAICPTCRRFYAVSVSGPGADSIEIEIASA